MGWIAFITENVVLSENRTEIIAAVGDDNYHRLYNTLSTSACLSIGWGFFKHGRGLGPALSYRSNASLFTGYILQSFGFVALSQLLPKFQIPVTKEPTDSETSSSAADSSTPPKSSFSLRCPMDFRPNDVPADGIYGIDRVSRHANLWTYGLIGLGYAATTVFVPEIVMCAWPAVFVYIGSSHQDSRYRRGMGGTLSKEKEEKTSNIPFVALFTGKQSWTALSKEIKLENAAVAVLGSSLIALRRMRR